MEPSQGRGVDELYRLALERPIAGYQWLLIAMDFGHDAAGDALSDVSEHCDEFRYNEEHAVPQAHLEAARAYLHASGSSSPTCPFDA